MTVGHMRMPIGRLQGLCSPGMLYYILCWPKVVQRATMHSVHRGTQKQASTCLLLKSVHNYSLDNSEEASIKLSWVVGCSQADATDR